MMARSPLIAVRSTKAGAVAVVIVFVCALGVKVASDYDRLAASAGTTSLPTAGFIYFRF